MRMLVGMVIAAALGLSVSALAQQPNPITCLHGPNESADQRDRRAAAVRIARMINSAEANGRTPYRSLSLLNVTAPAGWDTRLTTDGSTYAFSVKDTTDPCGFTLFSDEMGIIYFGEPIR